MRNTSPRNVSGLVATALLLLAAPMAHAELANGRYGAAQVFDAQRNPAYPVAGQPFTVFGLASPYSQVSSSQYTIVPGQYIQFFKVSDSPCRYGINLYNADGTLDRLISATGTIYGLGPEGFLHDSEPSNFGTFVANSAGYSNGGSVTFTAPVGEATCVETAAYAASTTPTASAGPLPVSQVASVPTLSESAMLITGALMALGIFFMTRRRS